MKNKRTNWPRYILQWGVLAAIALFLTGLIGAEKADPETYCPMGGLQAFITYLVRGSLPCSMSSVQIVVGLMLAAAVILFGKLFCSYLCPIGTVEDLLIKIRRGLNVKELKIAIGSPADKFFRIFKYALLFWIFYMTATASELFCKNLDPYYAVATGFKGEITLWMSLTTVSIVILIGFLVNNFWCRYLCPLGAISSTFKFWAWLLVLGGICWVLNTLGIEIPWWVFLGLFCLAGYILEVFVGKSRLQLLSVHRDEGACNNCGVCSRKCPYSIKIANYGDRVTAVDCNLCGECVAACKTNALHIGSCSNNNGRAAINFHFVLPACLTVVLAAVAIFLGGRYEIPTINEEWGIYSEDSLHTRLVDPSTLETVTLEGLKNVHCYGSSMAFKAKLQKIKGVYGVKTFVKSHKATITYDPKLVTPEKLQEEIYIPSRFKCLTPDYKTVPELRVITIRTEHMPAATDLNFLGIEFKQVDSLIYGLESEWACPLIVRLYVDPAFNRDAEWIKSIVEQPSLDLMTSSGKIKSTPTGYTFVKMEEGEEKVATTEFLQRMFSRPFTAEVNGRYERGDSSYVELRKDHYAGQPQFIYEIAGDAFSKPMYTRSLPFVSNHLSSHEGIIGVYTRLNADYVPSLQIRFAAPMTGDQIWKLLTMETWTITYKDGEVREEPARLIFKEEGIVRPFEEGTL